MNKNTYFGAGVNISAGNELVNDIKSLAQNTNRSEVISGIGGFGSLFALDAKKYRKPVLVSSTDGVGTKLMIAQALDRHDTIGIDLVAMCVNDILCHGAEPLFFLDYLATGKLKVEEAKQLVAGIAEACKSINVSLIGGETAEMPGMYSPNKYDLAGFCVGIVEQDSILPRGNIEAGDTILGIGSSGLHSNGFSLVRRILNESKINLYERSPWGSQTWGDILLTPTMLYINEVLPIIEHVEGVAHITGGGMVENIPRILPRNMTFELQYDKWPEIFLWLQQEGNVATEEMLKVFNCGIGMVMVVKPDKEQLVVSGLTQNSNVSVTKIGCIRDMK